MGFDESRMNLLEQFLDYVAPLKGSTKYKTWAFLTVCSALLERRVWLDRGRLGIMFPNIYTLLVGRPAMGKSFAAERAVELTFSTVWPLNSPPLHHGPTKITQAALYKEIKSAERPMQLAAGNTVLQSPVFLYASELAINMTDFGGGTLTNELIDFYDSKSLTAKMVKRTIKDDNIELSNPSITLLGCTTESFLQTAAQDKLITSGLASRIVFVVEIDRPAKQRELVLTDPNARRLIQIGMVRMYSMKGPMSFSADAQALYNKLADEADTQCCSQVGDFLQNYYGRKPDHISKLAIIKAAMDGRMTIGPEDLAFGASLLADIEPDMMKAFGMRSIAKDENAVAQVLPLIPYSPNWTTRTALLAQLQAGGSFMPFNGEYKAIIEGLKESGVVREQINTDGTGAIYQRIR